MLLEVHLAITMPRLIITDLPRSGDGVAPAVLATGDGAIQPKTTTMLAALKHLDLRSRTTSPLQAHPTPQTTTMRRKSRALLTPSRTTTQAITAAAARASTTRAAEALLTDEAKDAEAEAVTDLVITTGAAMGLPVRAHSATHSDIPSADHHADADLPIEADMAAEAGTTGVTRPSVAQASTSCATWPLNSESP